MLAAARHRWRAATHRPAQAASLPDPLLLYTEMVTPIETRGGPIQRDFQLVQRIPAPGKLSASAAVEAEKARIAEETAKAEAEKAEAGDDAKKAAIEAAMKRVAAKKAARQAATTTDGQTAE